MKKEEKKRKEKKKNITFASWIFFSRYVLSFTSSSLLLLLHVLSLTFKFILTRKLNYISNPSKNTILVRISRSLPSNKIPLNENIIARFRSQKLGELRQTH